MVHVKPAFSIIVLLLIGCCLGRAQTDNNPPPITDPSSGELDLSLDGTWNFTTDNNAVDNKDAKWDSLTVPGNWDVQPAYRTYLGKGWYRRTFTVPADWKGRHIRLCFGAVNQLAEVSLNGKSLGQHIGGYTPFEFDVTHAVIYGAENSVTVCADNSYHRGAWWPWGGISRSVSLVATHDARIVWQHIAATPDLDSGTAKIEVAYKVANDSDKELQVSLTSGLKEVDDFKITSMLALPPRSEGTITGSASLSKKDVRLWDFDHPNLYTMTTRLASGETLLHEKSDRFGIRKVEITRDGLLLNGEPVRLMGFNRVSDSDETGSTEPDELVHKDVDLMKSAGADFARLMHTPQAPNLLDYLDEKGMMIISEIPIWGGNDPQIKKDNPLTEQWLTEMINRDYNHPCIIGWSPGNEMRNHYAYVKSMLEFIRKNLDSSRLLTHTSNSAMGATPMGDPAAVSDFVMTNNYGGFAKAATEIRKRWPDKPIFFSEWGFSQIGPKLTARIPNFQKGLDETIKDHPYVIGLSIWTFNDYRNGFLGPNEKPDRDWGVVDLERHPKAAYYQVRKAFSPVHSITFANGKIRIEPRTHDEAPSYTLRGYQMKWTSVDAAGAVQHQGTILLPDLKPGDAPWETAVEGSDITASLVTPTGYTVDETNNPGRL